LPSLRERGEDILLLANHFLARAAADYGVSPRTLAPDTCARPMSYAWPGNVRELAHLMERVALLSETSQITAAMPNLVAWPAACSAAPSAPTTVSAPASQSMSTDVGSLDHAMADHIRSALEQTGWNLSRTAARLGIARNTLRVRIEKLGLRPGGAPSSAPPRAPAPRPPRPPAAGAGGCCCTGRVLPSGRRRCAGSGAQRSAGGCSRRRAPGARGVGRAVGPHPVGAAPGHASPRAPHGAAGRRRAHGHEPRARDLDRQDPKPRRGPGRARPGDRSRSPPARPGRGCG